MSASASMPASSSALPSFASLPLSTSGLSALPSASPSSSSASSPPPPSASSSSVSASAVAQSGSSPTELRASLLCLARCAERSERWDDVCRFVKESIKLAPRILGSTQQPDAADLSDDERQLLQLAYKHTIGQQRAAWKVMRQIQQQAMQQQQTLQQLQQQQQAQAQQTQQPGTVLSPPSSSSSSSSAVSRLAEECRFLELSEDYKQQLEKEIHLACSELIHLLESVLLKCVHRADSKCVYLKLSGDMYRYLAELVLARTGFSAQGCAGAYDKKSHECYSMAYKLAASALPANHPTRLQCALNLSVCLYEILRERKAACDIAKAAFDGAIAKLEELDEREYKDATLIMQLLRDNLTLWTQQSSSAQQQHAQQPGQ